MCNVDAKAVPEPFAYKGDLIGSNKRKPHRSFSWRDALCGVGMEISLTAYLKIFRQIIAAPASAMPVRHFAVIFSLKNMRHMISDNISAPASVLK